VVPADCKENNHDSFGVASVFPSPPPQPASSNAAIDTDRTLTKVFFISKGYDLNELKI
jgi:hypothetical protein